MSFKVTSICNCILSTEHVIKMYIQILKLPFLVGGNCVPLRPERSEFACNPGARLRNPQNAGLRWRGQPGGLGKGTEVGMFWAEDELMMSRGLTYAQHTCGSPSVTQAALGAAAIWGQGGSGWVQARGCCPPGPGRAQLPSRHPESSP